MSRTTATTMYQRLLLPVLLPILGSISAFSQDTLFLQNPSFEDEPRHSKVPKGWLNGGFPLETPPDIGPTDFFRADTRPSEGQTHLVMITRDFGTWERIANPLAWSMSPGQCYEFSIDLARAAVYLSRSRLTGQHISFIEPIRLRIWGSNLADQPAELLAVSPLIEHTDWQRYTFRFRPERAHALLILEAMYAPEALIPYSGNIMLDNASHLIPIDSCLIDGDELQALVAEPIPALDPNFEVPQQLRSIAEVDSTLIQDILNQVLEGQADIGLYSLANYVSQFEEQPWFLYWDEASKQGRRARTKVLKERIRGMGIQKYLRLAKPKKVPDVPFAEVIKHGQAILLFW